jgi:SAM-dependent methyltransferase
MEAQTRIVREQAFHDRQAQERAFFLRRHPGELIVRDDQYLAHEPWIRPALAKLGDVRGRDVLDFGCGHGMAAVLLARRGARVTAFDLSGDYIAEATARAGANGVTVSFVQANGEYLPFADESFDYVWGNAVLHHMDLKRTARELLRLLRPRGLAVFCEPWGGNPLLNWARRYVGYPGKERTPEEKPLTPNDVAVLKRVFPSVEMTGYQIFSMVARVIGQGILVKALARADDLLLRQFPDYRHWCRYMVLTLEKG